MHIQNPFKKHQEREEEEEAENEIEGDRQIDRQTDRNRERGKDYYTTSYGLSGSKVTPAHHPHGFPFNHHHHINPFQPYSSCLSVCLSVCSLKKAR